MADKREALELQYKQQNQELGMAMAGLAINAPLFISPLNAYEAVRSAKKIYSTSKDRDATTLKAAQQGFDIRGGHRKREIFKGIMAGAVVAISDSAAGCF